MQQLSSSFSHESSMLEQMLADPATKCHGVTKSTYRVVFLEDRHGMQYALKVFVKGPHQEIAEKAFKHEAKFHKKALENGDPSQNHVVLAVESGRV
jgi:hypothetical protein